MDWGKGQGDANGQRQHEERREAGGVMAGERMSETFMGTALGLWTG